jgi:hypothetical protein
MELKFIRASDIPRRRPAIKVTQDWVTIKTEWHREYGDVYEFTTERIDTPLKLLGWVHHLSMKCWFDGATCRELIDDVCDHFGWNPDNF